MYRKLHFVAVPALLILLTAGAVQARPLRAQAPPASLWTQVWQGLSSTWTGLWSKEGPGIDPSGTPHSSVQRLPMRGDRPSPTLLRN